MTMIGSHPPSDEGSTDPASGRERFPNRSGRSSAPAHPKSARQTALVAKAAREIDGEQLIERSSSDVGVVRLRVQRREEALVAARQRQLDPADVHRGAHRGFQAARARAREVRVEKILAYHQEVRGARAERYGPDPRASFQPRPPVLDGSRGKQIAGKTGAAEVLAQAPIPERHRGALAGARQDAPAQPGFPGDLLRVEGQRPVRGQRARAERACVAGIRADVVERGQPPRGGICLDREAPRGDRAALPADQRWREAIAEEEPPHRAPDRDGSVHRRNRGGDRAEQRDHAGTLTTTFVPLNVTASGVSGFSEGPSLTLPSRSKSEPWHGQMSSFCAPRTAQPRCGQRASKASICEVVARSTTRGNGTPAACPVTLPPTTASAGSCSRSKLTWPLAAAGKTPALPLRSTISVWPSGLSFAGKVSRSTFAGGCVTEPSTANVDRWQGQTTELSPSTQDISHPEWGQ